MAIVSAQEGGDSLASQRPSSKLSNPFANGKFTLETGDVVAFLGGTDVAAAQFTGHLETLLTAKYRDSKIHFPNFGWEGDTVFRSLAILVFQL